MAIAQAVIEFLHDRVGCKTLVSTHFHELAHLEDSLPQLRNVYMAVKESGRDVTFLRKLIPGAASTSYGIYCAQIAGLPDSIITRSYELLSAFEARSPLGAPLPATTSAAQPIAADATASAAGAGRAALPTAASHAETAAPAVVADRNEHPAAASVAPHSPGSTVNAAPVVQLSLFPSEADKPRKKTDARSEQVLEQLKHADLINMTPLQAINLIYELKQKLQEQR
jgi:DNA mismatch repair protein MutS